MFYKRKCIQCNDQIWTVYFFRSKTVVTELLLSSFEFHNLIVHSDCPKLENTYSMFRVKPVSERYWPPLRWRKRACELTNTYHRDGSFPYNPISELYPNCWAPVGPLGEKCYEWPSHASVGVKWFGQWWCKTKLEDPNRYINPITFRCTHKFITYQAVVLPSEPPSTNTAFEVFQFIMHNLDVFHSISLSAEKTSASFTWVAWINCHCSLQFTPLTSFGRQKWRRHASIIFLLFLGVQYLSNRWQTGAIRDVLRIRGLFLSGRGHSNRSGPFLPGFPRRARILTQWPRFLHNLVGGSIR